MPLVSPTLLKRIVRVASTHKETSAIFVARFGRVGFPCLLRATSVELIENQIAAKDFSLQALAQNLRARRVVVGAKNRELFNVNTPADIALAERWLMKIGKD